MRNIALGKVSVLHKTCARHTALIRLAQTMLPCDVVVIASEQRSGTTELAADLSHRANALNLGEYFNPWGGQVALPKHCAQKARLTMTARAAAPLETVMRTRDACGYKRALVRIFTLQGAGTLTSPNKTHTQLLAGPTCVIILERNVTDRFCSLQRVVKTKNWFETRDWHPSCPGINLNTPNARGFFNKHTRWFSTIRRLVRSVYPMQPVVELQFADLESRGISNNRLSKRNATLDALVAWMSPSYAH